MATSKTYASALKQLEQLKSITEALRKKEFAGVVKRIREAIVLYAIPASELYPPEGTVEQPKKKRAYLRKPPNTVKVDLTHLIDNPKPKRAKKVKIANPVVAVKKPRKTVKVGRGGARPPKFGDDQGNLWSGGGSTPVWLRKQLEAGRNKEEFRLK